MIDKLKIKFKKYDPRISKADELKKYADLRDKGIITEEEFQAKKKKLFDLLNAYLHRYKFLKKN